MERNKLFACLLLLVSAMAATGQVQPKTLSVQEVIAIVKKYHPLAKQADLVVEQSKAEVTAMRGGFDPLLDNKNAQKTFNGTDYYAYNQTAVVIPTWFGIELSAGVEYLGGSRTNPEKTTGETSYAGISLPLAKNLLMDKRRAALQTAKIYREASEFEKRNMLNNLLADASTAYWNWVNEYQAFSVLSNAVLVNEQRFALTRTAFNIGERPAIDTTESLSQLQSFEIMQNQSLLEFQNAGLDLSLFLWMENEVPYTLPEAVVPAAELNKLNPATEALPDLSLLLTTARQMHPELKLYDYKLDALNINKQLKFQELLPKIDLKYNQLGRGYDLAKTATTPFLENNFQYGVAISLPLRLSTGRGEYRLARLKITSTTLQRSQKQLEIENKVRAYFNELVALQHQLELQEKAYENFRVLQRGEETRYSNGESSLFLINSRENKTLEALQKLQDMKAKYYKTLVRLQWAAGTLFQ